MTRHRLVMFMSALEPLLAQHFGILYLRAGTLDGCSSQHSMAAIYPRDSGWINIREPSVATLLDTELHGDILREARTDQISLLRP
jgi:hypothetical protein